jgi:hypothetical protein
MKDFEVKEWVKCRIVKYTEDGTIESYPYFTCLPFYDQEGVFEEIDLWIEEGIYDEFRAYDIDGFGVDLFVEVLFYNSAQEGFEGRIEIPAYYDLKFTVITSESFDDLRGMNKC